MKKLFSLVSLVGIAALSMPVQVSAKDVDPVGSSPESSTSQPFATHPPVTTSRGTREALEYAEELLERALDAVSSSSIAPERRSELTTKLRQLIDRINANQLPEKSELERVLSQTATALASQTAAPTAPSLPSSSQPSSSPPSTTTRGSNSGRGSGDSGRGSGDSGRGSGDEGRDSSTSTSSPTVPPNAMPLSQILREAMSKVAASKLDAPAKAALTQKLQSIVDRATSGQIPPTSEIEQTLRQVASALGMEDPSKLNQPSGKTEDNKDNRGAPESDDDSAPSAGGSVDPSVATGAPGRGSSTQSRTPEKSRADLVEKIQEVLSKLQSMPTSPEIESAKTLLSSLLTRIQNGEMVPRDEVRGAMDQVKTIAFARLGRENPREEVEPAEAPSQEHLTQRMTGAIDEALRQLQAITTPDAITATTALSTLKDRIATGTVVTKDEFEQAMRLARTALVAKPGARASVTLAGVLSQLENSNASDEAKAAMLEVITKALEQAQLNPDADPTEAVKAALEQARAARVAAAVEKLRAITEILTADAEAASNLEALLILADVVAVLNPTDGATPTRDQLHEARATLEQVIQVLHPEAAPDDPEQSTTDPATSTTPESSPESSTAP